jgi:hypothetical protein
LDTISFDVFEPVDGLLRKAKAQFDRGEFSAALTTLEAIPQSFQPTPERLHITAMSHQKLRRYAEAVEAWEALALIEPGNAAARSHLPVCRAKAGFELVFGEACAAFQANKFQNVIDLLLQGDASWHKRPEFLEMMAWSHERLGKAHQAVGLWRDLLSVSPGHPVALIRIPCCLSTAGALDAAGSAFELAAERLPGSMVAQFNWLFFQLSRNPTRDQLAQALNDAGRLKTITGNPLEFRAQLDVFRIKLLNIYEPSQLSELDIANVLELEAVPTPASGSFRLIYEKFEPVGCDCEFGMAQRRYGAEPLALFRWTGIAPPDLVRLLSDRLENFDAPEHYRVEASTEHEFMLKEDVYATHSHTNISTAQARPDELLRKLTRRQSFLKRKFLDTAAEGEKIFVFKYNKPLPPETINAIERNLEALGARRFLFVLPAEQRELGGTTRLDSERRLTAFLSGFRPVEFEQWDSIVQRAHGHFFPIAS